MKELKFSIPYNGDINLIKWAVNSGKVYEVYFAGPKEYYFCAYYYNLRPHSQSGIFDLVSFCNKNKIRTNLLLNKNTLFFDNLKKIDRYLKLLEKIGNLDSVTITDPFLLPFLKARFPYIKIQSSIFMGIDDMQRVEEGVKIGITEFCLGLSVNRNAAELKRIMSLKDKYPQISIKLLGMHGCYANCLYLPEHIRLPNLKEILQRHDFKEKKYILGSTINPDKCFYKAVSLADEIRRPFIRPEDLSYYEGNRLADYIKIAYRNQSSVLLRDKLSAYFERSYKGNLFYLFESNRHREMHCDNKKIPRDFIKKVMNCNKACGSCSYCETIARDCIKSLE